MKRRIPEVITEVEVVRKPTKITFKKKVGGTFTVNATKIVRKKTGRYRITRGRIL